MNMKLQGGLSRLLSSGSEITPFGQKPSITILLPTSSLDQVYMKAVWYEKEEISQPGPARRRDAGRTGRTRSSPS